MQNQLYRLNWDSEFFGYPIAQINAVALENDSLHELINQAASSYKLIYLFTSPDDRISNDAALSANANLVDQKVTFRISLSTATGAIKDHHIIDYSLDHPSQKLIDLSLQSGIYSRFKTDPNFRNHEFEKLYLAWIENSVNKKIADHTLVYVEDGNELGVVTAKLSPDIAQIGVIAVDEHTRGKSIGSKLMLHLMKILQEKKVPILDVATQLENNSACHFYQKLGFDINTVKNIYHIWF